ncbi:parallel beta-helix domain-containing protein [Rhodanobacter sp. Si-c]|uniref:Parallel beta-helix domain-containing protein n=1 Tax=Rhodanobacter lycopersici TaxID=3162487 RepID=A0ABV3QDP0_9GAMM
MRKTLITVALATALAACSSQQAPAPQNQTDASFESKLQEQLLDAKPGTLIDIPAGTYHLKRGLSLRTDGVTIKGAGMDKTILSFKGQVVGPEGLLVNANDFTIENLTIEDTKGDALKINHGRNITIHGVRTQWTDGSKTSNGPYGIYPVKTQNVLIEDSAAIGASDSGIYVGQSNNVIVRNNHVERNVAGIEIENTVNADVYGNTATDNSGGILVFNMPDLLMEGSGTRVFKNQVIANNHDNFAANGSAVASVPAGSGVVVNSNPKVEIFDNDIADNKTANIIVSSFYSTNYASKTGVAAGYDPYPKGIFVYGNRLKGGGDSPSGLEFKTLKVALFGINGHFPDVLWDGYSDPKFTDKTLPPQDRICLQDVSGVVDADGPDGYKHPNTDMKPFQCTLDKLPAVTLNPEPKL